MSAAVRPERVVILGSGYVGLVTGACLASLGADVTCVDIDPRRVDSLRRGAVPFYEPGLAELVDKTMKEGRLRFELDVPGALRAATVIFIAVGTPQSKDGNADLTFIHAASASICADAPQRSIVVVRSTVPPGTGDKLEQQAAERGRSDLSFVSAPEFLAEGTAVHDFMEPARLVFGGPSEAAHRVASLFAGLTPSAPRIITDRRTSELAKYAANTFLAARISLVNEFANLADALGADVVTLARIVGSDPRIGPQFLRPGIGYGGSCFPKDVQAIRAVAHAHNVEAAVIEATEKTNQAQWAVVTAKARRLVGGAFSGKRIGVLGIAFKPGTDDTRAAPGLRLIAAMAVEGAVVRAHDPKAKLPAEIHAVQVPDARDAIADADLVILVTEWREYRELPWGELRSQMRSPVIVDGRNHLDASSLARQGYRVVGVGVPEVLP